MPDERGGIGDKRPRAVILGCAGERLTPGESRFFASADPLGFILFRRNCRSRAQVRELVAALRGCVGRPDAPVLIDQEGGRVARLQPPEWRTYPAAAQMAALPDPFGLEAVRLAARMIADDLSSLGITIDCAPVLDVPTRDADAIIGDRAYSDEPQRVARFGRAFCDGLLAGGVLPVIKHIPGHGRARVDSHQACPRVEASRAMMTYSDFAPFRVLSSMPWAMTAHIVFSAIDDVPATLSAPVIETLIRGDIGFGGVLVSDDIGMGALDGTLAERTRLALTAGCDLVLHCSGVLAEMIEVAEAAALISPATQARIARAEALRRRRREGIDRRAAGLRFAELMAGTAKVP